MNSEKKISLKILDMQPIDPPIGGGRIRLLGLYHNLGSIFESHYIGSYDWEGEKFRDHYVSSTLRETDIPLSEKHFIECKNIQERVNGKTIIDTTFPLLAHYSTGYYEYIREQVVEASIIIFSHPWVFPLVKDLIDVQNQVVVYDSQNVEGYLRFTLLNDGGLGTKIVREVVKTEYELCQLADTIFACSFEDCELFNRLYNIPFCKLKIVPNGVFTQKIFPVNENEKEKNKKKIGIQGHKTALFIGSNYPPNLEACNYIIDELAPQNPELTFIIAGGVGAGIQNKNTMNVQITGVFTEEEKLSILAASDLAINPMFSGSGTNIKMFDFMAAGLPIISTSIGARGIESGAYNGILLADKTNFTESIKSILDDKKVYQQMSNDSRKIVTEKYSWEKITKKVGLLINRISQKKKQTLPFFSVIIPTYERHDRLRQLITNLTNQNNKNFEVIVVDQSEKIWSGKDDFKNLDLFYIHSEIKGAVGARNLGSFYANGEVLAFTDDDCLPSEDWLDNAYDLFMRKEIIGIEGLIKSENLSNSNYRHVTNEGFEGIGFMTANLFISREIFLRINGFDENFDHPHFREDTDLGWRAQKFGDIPFAKNVWVLHPPHLRSNSRESLVERNKFFEKDPLLLKKHPEKFMQLFFSEGHWKKTEGYWENFIRGAKKYNVNLLDYDIIKFIPKNLKRLLL